MNGIAASNKAQREAREITDKMKKNRGDRKKTKEHDSSWFGKS